MARELGMNLRKLGKLDTTIMSWGRRCCYSSSNISAFSGSPGAAVAAHGRERVVKSGKHVCVLTESLDWLNFLTGGIDEERCAFSCFHRGCTDH